MRRRLTVKFNCVVLLFVSVGQSNGLSAEYRRAYSNSSLHPFGYNNTLTSSRTATSYATNGGIKTSSNSWQSSGTHRDNGGTITSSTTIQKTCSTRNGVKSCNVFQSQNTKTHYQYANILLKITKGISINNIISRLQQNLEFRNEIFIVCTCQNHRYCRCTSDTSTYTITKAGYCLCLEEQNGESKCICNPHILEIQITSTTIVEGCLCYNAATSLNCYCRQIGNEGKYDINKYTSLEINIGNEYRIEGFGTAIYSKFSPQDRGHDFLRCQKLPICTHEEIKYSHNSIFRCLCVDDHIDAIYPNSCTCNPYILQPKIKYNGKLNLQTCNCIMTNAESFCSCNKYIESGQTPLPNRQPYNSTGIFDLVPLGKIGIDALRQNFKDNDQFRNENIITCACRTNGRKLECNCDKTTTEYKMTNPGYCLCIDPKPNWNRVDCLCNLKILTPKFRYNIDMYTLKGCICVHNIRSNYALGCTCRDIEAEYRIDTMKYSSKEVNLPSVKMTITQIRDIIISKFEINDKQYDIYSCFSDLHKCRGNFHYRYNGLAPCLCLEDSYSKKCICNQYVPQLKIRYNPKIIPLQTCNCVNDEQNRAICKCAQLTPQTGGYKPYKYENVLIILPEKSVTISVIRQEFLNTVEFSEQQFNVCACVPKGHFKYACSCTESTKVYTKQEPGNCLCVHSYERTDSMKECLCNEHILKPAISYSKSKISLLDCSCCSSGGNVNSLTCDCKSRPPYSPNYGLVLIDIKNEVLINIEILMANFIEKEEYRLERFNKCTCADQTEKLPCSCVKNYYQPTQHKPLNCLCIIYHSILQLPQCLCSDHVLLADIAYDSSIELRECICKSFGTKDPICNCKRKKSFNPNYNILIEITNEVTITNILNEFKRKVEFRHEHFTKCRYLNNYVTCSSEVSKELYTSRNQSLYSCLCIHPQTNNNPTDCLCSHHVIYPAITYNIEATLLQACICQVKDSKCNCRIQPSFQPIYDRILMEFRELTIDINIIFNFLKGRWEFEYEAFNQCHGTRSKSALTLSCTEQTHAFRGTNHCNCLCVFHKTNSVAECLCSTNVLKPSITYNTGVNNLQECICSQKGNAHQLACHCNRKPSIQPRHEDILIEFQEVKININIIRTYFERWWQFKYEDFNYCKGTVSKPPLIISCSSKTLNNNNCMCVFNHKTKAADCLCSTHILMPNITYNTNLNDLQGCRCHYVSTTNGNANHLSCNCIKKPSFEPRYDLILLEFLEVTIDISIILRYFEERWEFQYEQFNECKGTGLTSPMTLSCIQNTQLCHDNHCNCLCVINHESDETQCLCSRHVLSPNITYISTLNDLQGCTCHNNGNIKEKANQLACNCVKKLSFQPRYDRILIKWPQVTIDITVILTYLKQRWEFQYEIYNTCNGTGLKSPLTLSCTENTQSCNENDQCNCLCVFHNKTNAVECVCSSHILLPNITYSTSLNNLQGCTCIYKGNEKQLACNCVKKPTFDPQYDLVYTDFGQLTIHITYIRIFLQESWEFQYENFNECTGTSAKTPLTISCTQKTQQCTRKNPCNCLCMLHHDTSPTDCLCNDYVLLPNITYSTTKNDLQGCKCFHSTNIKNNDSQLICDCVKKPSFEPRYDLILIEWQHVRVDITVILTYLRLRWEFQHEVLNLCNGTSLKSPLSLTCTEKSVVCEEDNCKCLCVFNNAVECVCSPHVLLPNITYSPTLNVLQECSCIQENNTNQLKCNCEKKPSFNPQYDILIELREERINIIIILAYLQQRWEFQYEIFNQCKGNSLKSPLTLSCTEKTQECSQNHHCNCLCVFNQTISATECLCSPHVLLPNITYSTTLNNLQGCACFYKNNDHQMTCNCVQKPSFEPKYNRILIEFKKVTLNIHIITKYLQQRWEFRHEVFNHCKGTDLKSPLPLTCKGNVEACTGKNYCSCLCIFDHKASVPKCLCSPHILLPNIKYNATINDLQGCSCLHKGNTNQLTCNCVKKASFEPEYDLILIELPKVTIHINIILTYLEARWEFQYEVFNLCKGSYLKLPLQFTCTKETQECKGKKLCNCLCVFDQATSATECLCNPHVLQPNITYSTTLNNIQGCTCLHKGDINQIECNCVKKPSFEPKYDLVLIDWHHTCIEINITMIITYLQQRWEFQHEVFNVCKGTGLKSPVILTCGEVFNMCKGTSLKSPLIVTCTDKTQACTENNQCNCLCVFNQSTHTVECACSPHVLLPNITYSTTLNDLQECTCVYKSNSKQLSCNCMEKPSFEPRYNLVLMEWYQIKIEITNILAYLQQTWQFRHEVFNLCSGTSLNSSLVLTCKEKTQSCTEKNQCNCLCVFHHATNAAECLCNPHILLPNIKYTMSMNDLQGCTCVYNGDSNLLTGDCSKKLSFEPKYDILIEWLEVRIDITIILTYLQQRSEFQYEVFNQCHGSKFQIPLLLNCTEKTEIHTGNNHYNCLCVIHQENKNSEVECLCSAHVLLPNIKYNTSLNNIQACKCLHKDDGYQLSCDCEIKPSFEPKYDLILIELHEVQVDITIILSYLRQRWEFQYEEFNHCSSQNLNAPLILSCSQNTEVYTANNRYNCLCVFYHAFSTTDCLCNTHVSLVTFTYNITLNDLQICNCQTNGETTQLICDCEKKESFQPRYEFILIDAGKYTLNIESILDYFTARSEFHYETFSQLNCKDSKLPLSCTWEDKEGLRTQESSFNCLCVLSNFPKRAARCLCSQHILIPDITYDMNENNLQSCNCHYIPKNGDQVTCKCSRKESFIPKYGQIELNFYYKHKIKITFVLEYLKNTMDFRNEKFNVCNCTKTNRVVSCNCENDTESYTVTKPGECLCTWSSYNNKAECLCSTHILEVKYKFSSQYLKLGNCLCHNIGNGIRSLVCDCDEMTSMEKRYLNFIIDVPSERKGIMGVAKLISANFTHRDKMFDMCTNINYGNCLNSTTGNKPPCLCVDSDYGAENGCACSLYIVQPMILYNRAAYKLYRCSFDTKWNCQLVYDELKVITFKQSIRSEPEIKNQKIIMHVNQTYVIPNPSSMNITRRFTSTITKQITRYVTNTNVRTVNVPDQRTITSYSTRSVRVNPFGQS